MRSIAQELKRRIVMMIIQNIECGNIHLSIGEMVDEGAKMYGLYNSVLSPVWAEYYQIIEV